jgi:hypothetical protein
VWEGALKVVSKGEDCIIKLEDKNTGTIVTLVLLVCTCEVYDINCLSVFQESCTLRRFSERVNHTRWNLLLIAAGLYLVLPHNTVSPRG